MAKFIEDSLIPVLFNKDTILLVQHEGLPFVPLRPIVQNLGLDWASQFKKIRANEKRWGVVMITTPSEGGMQPTCCIPMYKLPAFLYSIEPAKVKPAIRPKLEEYQEKCDEALWNFWSGKQREDEEQMRRIFREEMTGYRLVKIGPAPCTPEEIRRLKSEILAGAGTSETARKFGRHRHTVMVHTVAERAEMRLKLLEK